MKSTRGGKRGGSRPGAGRPPGTGTGRNAISKSISLTEENWVKLDKLKGKRTRSGWVADRVEEANQ